MGACSPTSPFKLSKVEIDEILDSPYETNYTYCDSIAYKPLTGSYEYVHPRLCRRFPSRRALSSASLFSSTETTAPKNAAAVAAVLLLLLLFAAYDELHQPYLAQPGNAKTGIVTDKPSILFRPSTRPSRESAEEMCTLINKTKAVKAVFNSSGQLSMTAKSSRQLNDSVAFRERLVFQCLMVDYIPSKGSSEFWDFNVSCIFSHPVKHFLSKFFG